MSGARMVFWPRDDGQRIAMVVEEPPTYTYLVMLDEGRGVRRFKAPNVTRTKGGRAVPIRLRETDYSLRKARAHWLRMGKTWGISPSAKRALKEAI